MRSPAERPTTERPRPAGETKRLKPTLKSLRCVLTPWLALFFSITFLAACSEPLYKQQGHVFGTLAEVSIYGVEDSKAKDAADEILREFERLQQLLNGRKPGELSSLNAALARQGPAKLSPEMAGIIRETSALSEKSGGRFNPAIGKLIALWHFNAGESTPAIPAAGTIAALVKTSLRMADITVSGDSVSSNNPAAQLDFDGYTKGHALDRARALLKARGIRNALVNIGGNILALGEHGTRPWKVGIQHPRREGPIATIELYDGETIATAGDYQRYFERDGKRYCDVIDPATGYPAQGVEAATVLTKPGEQMGALAEVASRALFVSGATGWRATAKRMGVDMAMLVDEKGEVTITAPLARRIEFKLPKPVAREVP